MSGFIREQSSRMIRRHAPKFQLSEISSELYSESTDDVTYISEEQCEMGDTILRGSLKIKDINTKILTYRRKKIIIWKRVNSFSDQEKRTKTVINHNYDLSRNPKGMTSPYGSRTTLLEKIKPFLQTLFNKKASPAKHPRSCPKGMSWGGVRLLRNNKRRMEFVSI